MYSRNCGSNWPRSWALIARSTRGSALIGPGPISSRGAGLRSLIPSLLIRMVLQPVARDVDAPGDPDLLAAHVLEKALERGEPPGPADEPAVQADRHHARHAVAFLVEDVEGVLEIGEELVARVESLGGGETHVVRVQRIGHDELRPAALVPVPRVVPGKVIVVVVGIVDEPAVLDHELARVRAGAPGVPAERTLAGELAVNLDRALHVLALDRFGDILVVDPAPSVARDLVPGLEQRVDRGGVALHRHRDPVYGKRHLVAREELEDPPHTYARAVLVDRLHRHVAHALQRPRADDLGKEGFRGRVAVQDRVFAAFFVVE